MFTSTPTPVPNSTGGSSIIIISVISLIVISRQDMYDVRTCMHDLLRLQISNFTIFNAIIILSGSCLVSQLARTERISQKTSINFIAAITISYSVMDFDFFGGLSFEDSVHQKVEKIVETFYSKL